MARRTRIPLYALGVVAALSLSVVAATPASAAEDTAAIRSTMAGQPMPDPADARAAAATCSFKTNGDYVHISSSEPQAASGHGWWVNTDCPTPLADVSVRLQILAGGTWTDVAWGSEIVYSGGGSGNRASARKECRTMSWNQWRSVVDVDLVGIIDTPEVYTTPARGLYCGI